MTDVTFNGIDVDTVVNAAMQQPVGQQKAKYVSDVATLLGANPYFEIVVGGTVVYRANALSMTTSAAGIGLPAQFTEPPTVNIANALTDPSAVIRIRNALNATIYVTVPVKAGGAAGFLTASGALSGTQPVRTSNVLFKPPSILDVTGSTSSHLVNGEPRIPIDTLIQDMTTASIQPRFGTHRNAQAAIQAGNWENLQGYIDAGPTTSYKMYDYWDEILPWFWVYAGQGHNDSLNLRLQYGYGVISVMRVSDGTWVDTPVRPGTSFDGYMWDGNTQSQQMLTSFGDYLNHSDGTRSSRFTGNWGCELWYDAMVNQSLMQDSRSIGLIAVCRIIDSNGNPYYGPNGCYAVKMGYDLWGRGAPGTAYYQGGDKYWGNAADGGSSRWKQVKNGDWTAVACVVMHAYNDQPGNGHLQDWTAATPWTLPPWIPDEAEIRANPPNWAF